MLKDKITFIHGRRTLLTHMSNLWFD